MTEQQDPNRIAALLQPAVVRKTTATATTTQITLPDVFFLEVPDSAREAMRLTDDLFRAHFADTPLALQSIIRTSVIPWDVELHKFREMDGMYQKYRVVERTRLVEHPRGGDRA